MVRAAGHALAPRRQAAVRVAPDVAEGIGERPRFRPWLRERLAIELRRAARDQPSSAIESAQHQPPDAVRPVVIRQGEVDGALTVEPRELGWQIVGAHGAELGESLIGGQRAGEVPQLALHAPKPHQRARPHVWVAMVGQRAISHNGTRGVTAELDRFATPRTCR